MQSSSLALTIVLFWLCSPLPSPSFPFRIFPYLLGSVLLVGETGCGKTSVIQHLAEAAGRKLIVQVRWFKVCFADALGTSGTKRTHMDKRTSGRIGKKEQTGIFSNELTDT